MRIQLPPPAPALPQAIASRPSQEERSVQIARAETSTEPSGSPEHESKSFLTFAKHSPSDPSRVA